MPSLEVNSFEFLDKPYIAKTRVLGLSVSKNFGPSLRHFDITAACDRPTDNSTMANTWLCIANDADAL